VHSSSAIAVAMAVAVAGTETRLAAGMSLAMQELPSLATERSMQAQDIMAKNPASVTPDTPVQEAAKLMQREDVGVLPVVESGSKRLVGLVTDRDITIRVVAEGRDASQSRVQDAMSSNLKTCKPDDDVDDVMDVMGREQVRRIPIVNDRGELLGVVSQADIVRETKDDEKAERTVEQISKPGGRHSH
jgi:CBS domain-containing protein